MIKEKAKVKEEGKEEVRKETNQRIILMVPRYPLKRRPENPLPDWKIVRLALLSVLKAHASMAKSVTIGIWVIAMRSKRAPVRTGNAVSIAMRIVRRVIVVMLQ